MLIVGVRIFSICLFYGIETNLGITEIIISEPPAFTNLGAYRSCASVPPVSFSTKTNLGGFEPPTLGLEVRCSIQAELQVRIRIRTELFKQNPPEPNLYIVPAVFNQ